MMLKVALAAKKSLRAMNRAEVQVLIKNERGGRPLLSLLSLKLLGPC